MDIQRDNFFPGRIYEPDFMQGKLYGRPHRYPKLENKQRLNLPAMPHSRFNKIPDRTHYRNDIQFGDGSDWATFPVMKLTQMGWVCDYDGVAMYGNCGNHASLNITGALSIRVRMNPASVTTAFGSIVDKWNTFEQYMLRQETTTIMFYLKSDGTTVKSGPVIGSVLSVGIWIDIVAVRDGADMDMYINKVKYAGVDKFGSGSLLGTATNVGFSMYQKYNGKIANVIIKALAESAAKQRDDYWRQA